MILLNVVGNNLEFPIFPLTSFNLEIPFGFVVALLVIYTYFKTNRQKAPNEKYSSEYLEAMMREKDVLGQPSGSVGNTSL